MKRITIDPITRLEGHGKIEIFLNELGKVKNAYLQIPELRGFEKFCEGRPVEELPRITAQVCGVCPEAHHLAATKAIDQLFDVDPPSAAKKLRELFYCAHIIHSHIAHFFALAAPDFILGPDAPPSKRNILGVVAKAGKEVGAEVIKHRAYAQEIQALIGGRATLPVCGLPGGCSKSINENERIEIQRKAESCVNFSLLALQIFDDLVLKNQKSLDLIVSKEHYYTETYYMGLVDKNNQLNFYDGTVRILTSEGKEYTKFNPQEYLHYFAEAVEPWTYLKFPYLRNYINAEDAPTIRVNSLARLNISEGMPTEKAQKAYDKFYETLGGKPVHNTLAFHWARLVELLYASERMLELSKDAEITSEDIRTIPTTIAGEGVGIIEAPRGTLIHHFKSDEEGLATAVNLIVSTTFNHKAINESIAGTARSFINGDEVSEGLLNRIEMAFRAYDPCFSCATHALPGHMPMRVQIRNENGKMINEIIRR